MSNDTTNGNPKKRMTRKTRLFIKTFLIAFSSMSVVTLIVAGVIVWNRTVVSPTVPAVGLVPMPVERCENSFYALEHLSNPNTEYDAEDSEQDFEYIWPAPERFTDDDRREMFFTFLVIGLNEGTNVNTAMVASYCGITMEASLISIPRDVPVHPTRRGRKLSSSYLVGSGGGRGIAGGIAQVQRDIMNVIGFIPDFYVVVDYDAFFAIIDAIGGIDIYVPMRMRYTDPCQDLDINIYPGLQHMDAQTALNFARFRQGDAGYPSPPSGDYFRIESQQAIIDAVIGQLLRPVNILKIPEFVNIFNDSVYTNLTVGNMLWFANQLNHVRGADALSSYTIPTTGTSGAPMWYELLDAMAVVELVNNTINPFYEYIELRDLNIIR